VTNSAACGSGKAIDEAAIHFGDQQQALFCGWFGKTQGVHPGQSQPDTEDLARAQVIVVAGGYF
jgi:hypothetical protein